MSSPWTWVVQNAPAFVLTFTLILAFFTYLRGSSGRQQYLRFLAGLVVAFRLMFATLLSVFQYVAWSANPVTSVLLETPLNEGVPLPGPVKDVLSSTPLGYFIFYSFGRFWLNPIITIGVALLFWWILKLLQKYRQRFFNEGEVTLGLLTCLIVGWPNVVVFVPLTMLMMAALSIVRLLVFKKRLTTIGWPLLLAAAVTLVWGGRLVGVLGLGVLRV